MEPPRQQIANKFRDLMNLVRENRPHDDLAVVEKAFEFAMRRHEGQQRASGEPYLIHLLESARIVAGMKLDPLAVAAALLHDTVEDTGTTSEEISEQFGEQVAHIVEGVTKISKIDFASREERQAESVRKM